MKGLEDNFSNLTVGHCKMCDITIQANIFVSNMASDIDVGFFLLLFNITYRIQF